jgi:uncharacterized protein YbaA (DUF1428 family)
MTYVDGFVVPLPKDKLDVYEAYARKGGDIWKEHGALAYVECVQDDVPYGELTSFPRSVQVKEDELVVFAYIVYPSREKRDEVMAAVMKDPRSEDMMKNAPFDTKRMIFGGFRTIIEM